MILKKPRLTPKYNTGTSCNLSIGNLYDHVYCILSQLDTNIHMVHLIGSEVIFTVSVIFVFKIFIVPILPLFKEFLVQ